MVISGQAARTGTSRMRPLLTVFLGWLWVMAGVNLAAPLYGEYAADYGFGGFVLTTVFATYAVTLVATLLVSGRLADRVGGRPVVLGGLVVACLALLVFAAAQATWWLYTARALQGVAVGLVSGPATAALVELDPDPGTSRPALLAGMAQAAGSGLGPLLSGSLAAWAPAPFHLSYLVGLVGTLVAAGFAWTLPATARGEEPWRVQWPRVPAEMRGTFFRLGLTAGVVWASLALFLSVVPSYVADLLSTDNLALLGLNSALACFASALAQVWARRSAADQHRAQAWGLGLLAVGLGLLVASSLTHSLASVLVGAVVLGAGHGLAFLSAQDELNSTVPAAQRGEVSAAFVCCIYVLVGGSVVAIGLLEEVAGLTPGVVVVGGALTLLAVAAAWWRSSVSRRVRT
jgi:hypothetical protein